MVVVVLVMCAPPAQVILSVLPVLRLLVQHDIFTLLALFSLRHHTQKLRLVFLSISEQTTSQKYFIAMTKAIPTCFKPVLAITISNRQSEKRLTSTKYFAKKGHCFDVFEQTIIEQSIQTRRNFNFKNL